MPIATDRRAYSRVDFRAENRDFRISRDSKRDDRARRSATPVWPRPTYKYHRLNIHRGG